MEDNTPKCEDHGQALSQDAQGVLYCPECRTATEKSEGVPVETVAKKAKKKAPKKSKAKKARASKKGKPLIEVLADAPAHKAKAPKKGKSTFGLRAAPIPPPVTKGRVSKFALPAEAHPDCKLCKLRYKVTSMAVSELVAAYNVAAVKHGIPSIAKFADRCSGEGRTLALMLRK